MLRSTLLRVSRMTAVRDLAMRAPVTREIVRRYVAGEQADDAVRVADALAARGLCVTIDHLGEDIREPADAESTVQAYLTLLDGLSAAGLTQAAEVSVKLSAVGQALPGDGERIALDHARTICARAAAVGTTVTLDMEDHTTTDSTLGILRDLRVDFPATGAVLQAYLRRTEGDCRDLATEGSRVRLCKGAYDEPATVAYASRAEIDKAFVRCLSLLMSGAGYPMVASHDPRLIEIAGALAVRAGRPRGGYEFQLLHGVRPDEQQRLADEGETVRVYVPYGADWYGYLVRRMAEKPANMALFVRSLATRG